MKTVGRLEAAIEALATALRETRAPFMLIGGIAVIARGVARVTADVDATTRAEGLAVDELARVLAHHDIVGRIPDLLGFAAAHHVLLLRHAPTGTPIKVSLAWLPFEEEALARAEPLDLVPGCVPVARAEDLVVTGNSISTANKASEQAKSLLSTATEAGRARIAASERPGDGSGTESLRSSAHSAPCVLAEA